MPDARIWISRAMMDSTRVKGFDHDVYFADKDAAVDAMRRNKRGEPLPAERFPNEMYGAYRDYRLSRMPDLFNAGGFWTVSAACADLLSGFELGRTALYPTRLYQHDRRTPIEGEYFCLSFGETKQAFVPEQSPRARKPYAHSELRTPPYGLKPFDMAVRSSTLESPKLWIDPQVRDAFFVSGRLGDAIKSAGMNKSFSLFPCRVIYDH